MERAIPGEGRKGRLPVARPVLRKGRRAPLSRPGRSSTVTAWRAQGRTAGGETKARHRRPLRLDRRRRCTGRRRQPELLDLPVEEVPGLQTESPRSRRGRGGGSVAKSDEDAEGGQDGEERLAAETPRRRDAIPKPTSTCSWCFSETGTAVEAARKERPSGMTGTEDEAAVGMATKSTSLVLLFAKSCRSPLELVVPLISKHFVSLLVTPFRTTSRSAQW